MTRDETDFIKDTLVNAIDWSSYADDYFREKHNLKQDLLDVRKSIELLDSIESRTCESCKYWIDDLDGIKMCTMSSSFAEKEWTEEDFGCNKWEQK